MRRVHYPLALASCLISLNCGSQGESTSSPRLGDAPTSSGGSHSGFETTRAGAGATASGSGGTNQAAGNGSNVGGRGVGSNNSSAGGNASTPTSTGNVGGSAGVDGTFANSGASTTLRGGAGNATATGGTTPTSGASSGGAGLDEPEQYTKPAQPPLDEDGSLLWLRYTMVPIPQRLAEYQGALGHVVRVGTSATLQAAQTELVQGLSGLIGRNVVVSDQPQGDGAVVVGTPDSSTVVRSLALAARLSSVGAEGYIVEQAEVTGKKAIVVAANTDVGVLRGSFALLRHLQCHRRISGLALSGAPTIKRRILNHWDNLDGTVERGYAGRSIWSWGTLPGTISKRYKDYARANASIGINGTVLNNVNSNAQVLTSQYIAKVAALADVFRPYGIAVYLSARFSAPVEIGGLSTADPYAANVKKWWSDKAVEIYKAIPDFGGFLVKANSEGQPGPQDYNRSHADGAQVLADAVAPHGGIVSWRAFVYSQTNTDRIRQAYDEFKPLDGKFASNVLLQVKNGPLDFQPREPFHPLFGAMLKTPIALELQITKEYLGQDTHLAFLGPLYEEVLKADTYANGGGSTIARVVDGSLHGYSTTAIAGVANIGSDVNWTGSHFNQANWYAYGRMAWEPDISAKQVADEWVRQTFSNDPMVVTPVAAMLMGSREAVVDYMTPLGLAHIMASEHHYGPGPWIDNLSRPEWNPVYYHKANATGLGFDRTSAGSNAVEQYAPTVRERFGKRGSVPEDLLLFFHRVGWDERLSTGKSVWEELVFRYSRGVDAVGTMRESWKGVQGRIDAKRHTDIASFLLTQHYEARWWRDACLQYFASVSKHTIPSNYATPTNTLAFYQNLTCPSDVTRPRCDAINKGDPSPTILR